MAADVAAVAVVLLVVVVTETGSVGHNPHSRCRAHTLPTSIRCHRRHTHHQMPTKGCVGTQSRTSSPGCSVPTMVTAAAAASRAMPHARERRAL